MNPNVQNEFTLGIHHLFARISSFILAISLVIIFIVICSGAVILLDTYMTNSSINYFGLALIIFIILFMLLMTAIYSQLFLIQKHLAYLKDTNEFNKNNNLG